MATSMKPASGSTVDEAEVARFSALAAEWWDPRGRMGVLHKFNPVRLGFIKEAACRRFERDGRQLDCLAGLRILDIGCGAGILSEPLARLGAAMVELPLRDAGCLLPTWDELVELSTAARERGVPLHADGARIWESVPHWDRSLAQAARSGTQEVSGSSSTAQFRSRLQAARCWPALRSARIAAASSTATRAHTAVVDRGDPSRRECRSRSLEMTSSGTNHRNPL